MKKSKFDINEVLSLGGVLDVPTYEEVEARMLEKPEDEMAVNPSYNKNGELASVEYKDTLSSNEALKKTLVGAVRFVSGHTKVVPGRAFIREMKAKRATEVLGHKYWARKHSDYYWEYLFDEKKHLTETYGRIEGRKTFGYDEMGRLSEIKDFDILRSKNDEPVEKINIAYDEQGRFSKITKECLRYGFYKFRDGEKVKDTLFFAYDKEGGYVATLRSSVDGHSAENHFEYHCNKENDIQMKVEKDSNDNIIKKENCAATKINPLIRLTKGSTRS